VPLAGFSAVTTPGPTLVIHVRRAALEQPQGR
jgi:hypothetical protein